MTALLEALGVGALMLVGGAAATGLIFVVIKLGERGIDAIDRTGAATVIPIARARRLRAARLELQRGLINRRRLG